MTIQKYISGAIACFLITNTFALHIPDIIVKRDTVTPLVLKKASQVIIITKNQIKTSGATNISQVLASQSSVQLQDLTGDGSNVSVSMRGFGDNAASNTLILINGIPQNNPDTQNVNLNRIPIKDVERIIIMPGSQSVLYGDQAVAGAVNIITKQPEKASAQIGMGFGSYEQQMYHFNVSNKYKNGFSYLVGGDVNAGHNYRRHNNDDQRNLLLDLGYHYATGSLGVRYDFYHQLLQYAGALTGAQEAVNRRQEEPGAPNNFERDHQHDITIDWKQLVGSNWVSRNTFSYHDYFANGQLYGAFKQKRRVLYIDPKMIGQFKHGQLTVGGAYQHDFLRT